MNGWVDAVRHWVKMGWIVLSYMECAMDGDLSESVDDWRGLYAQSSASLSVADCCPQYTIQSGLRCAGEGANYKLS